MWNPSITKSGGGIASLMFAGALAGCAGSTAPYAPLPSFSSPNVSGTSAAKAVVRSWSRNMMQSPLPSAGCFRASYPAIAWSRVACVAAPDVSFPPPARGKRNPAIIGGNGNQYAINVLPLAMVGAIGTIEDVEGAKTITSCPPKDAKGNTCGSHALGSNVYSLQLNSNNFSTAVCGKTIHCAGWEQFVYTNQPSYYSGGGNLIIQDWLLSTGTKSLKCQAGWIASKPDCYRNAPYSILVPTVPIASLQDVALSGSATSSGDSVFLSDGFYVYGMKNAQDDGIMDLSDHWTAAQFNIIGNSSGNRAVLNQGTTITISVEAVTTYAVAPRCGNDESTTAESNNLSFVTAPLSPQNRQYPSILFTESNKSGGAPSCDALPGN
jgi:hypothetical protein